MSCIEYKEYKERFQVIASIGKGNYASVLKIQDIKSKKVYALKYTKFSSADKLSVAFQEIEVIRAINHPLAIQIVYYFTKLIKTQKFISNQVEFGVIMELGDRSLSQDIFMRKRKFRYYSQQEIQDLSETLINFFAQMQTRGYLHRDIKPENILILTPPGTVLPAIDTYRVCDFGFAIKSHDFSDQNIAGTASYASPKIRNKFEHAEIFIKGNNYRDDAYSLGITLIETCILQTVEENMPKKLLPLVCSRYGDKFASLLQSMIEFEQSKRLDFLQLSQYFEQNLKIKKIESSKQIGNNTSVHLYDVPLTTPIKNKMSKGRSKQHKLEEMQSTAVDSQFFQNMQKNPFIQQNCIQFAQHPTDKKKSPKKHQDFRNTDKKKEFSPKKSANKRNQEPNHQIKSQKPSFARRSKEQNNSALNFTPKTTKFSQNPEHIFLPTSSLQKRSDDKIKTKRRSKLIGNSNSTLPVNFQGISYKQIMKETQNNLNQLKKLNQNMKKEQLTPNLPKSPKLERTKNLFRFQKCSEIQFLIVADIFDEEDEENKLVVIAITNGHFFICSHSFGYENIIIEVKFDIVLRNIKFVKYCSNVGKLILVCDNQIIHTLNSYNLVSTLNYAIQKKNYSVTSTQMGFMKLNTNTSGLIAICVNQLTGDIFKGFKNGEIFQNNKLVASGIKRTQIDFLIKWGRFMFVGSRDGTITKHSYKESTSTNGFSHLLGYFNCKCTVVGMQLADLGQQKFLLILLYNGFTLYFNENLDVVKSKQISKSCISAGKIDFSLEVGRRIIAVNSLGHVVNESGKMIGETGIKDCENVVYLSGRDKIILVTQSKSIFESRIQSSIEDKQKVEMQNLNNEQCKLKIQENVRECGANNKIDRQVNQPPKSKIDRRNTLFY